MFDRRKAHTNEELIDIFKRDNIAENYFSKFIAYYKMCYDELLEDHKDWEDEDWNEGDSVQAMALWVTYYFIKPYLELIAKGHSEQWAYELADYGELDETAVYHIHYRLKGNNPELAAQDLFIHAKSLGGDEHFVKYYMYLCEIIEEPKKKIGIAQNYSRIYKKELQKGKSAIFAEKYADLMSDGYYNQIYCEDYAYAYDKALNESKSLEYAKIYGDKYGSALVDIKRRHGISDDEEMLDFAAEKVTAYMNAWEYAQAHYITNFESFASSYETTHLDIYFADAGRPNMSREEIDKLVLGKVISRFK